jgi:UDP-N-acetylmuramoylalanine--D-glutamate ligase
MIAAADVEGRKVALFGLGGSGLATAKSLLAGGAHVLSWDDNPLSVQTATDNGVTTRDLRVADWSGIAALVLAPGVPLTHPKPHWVVELARANGVEIIGDVDLFARARRAGGADTAFVAITGTNGKSTTTALIAHMLSHAGRKTQMGGNIGKAVLTLEPFSDGQHYVVECSSYQIDLAPSLDPDIGILLNLTPDHLDRHGSMENYSAIKERLVTAAGLAIIGYDDSFCRAIADRREAAGARLCRISVSENLDRGLFCDGESIFSCAEGRKDFIGSLAGIGSLRGRHNAQNALAAVAACLELGLSNAEIQAGLQSFPGLAHRMEQVGRKGRVLFVNDSKATNGEAVAPALSAFHRIYWIAGGLPKEGGISGLKRFFPRIAKAYLIGEAAPAFSAEIGDNVPFEISGTLELAVRHAADDAEHDNAPESVVLLSPACASFDQFRNFEVRGDAFRNAVLALEGVEPVGGSR